MKHTRNVIVTFQEVALQRAEENGMDQLQEHIRLYMAMVNDFLL